MQISGNTILITGATSGIGRALAESLHQRGNQVIIAGRRRHLLNEIAEKNPGMVAMELDAANPASIETFATEIKKRFPGLNVLLNNAGISQREDYRADTVETSVALNEIQTNITGVLLLTAALLPTLRAQSRSTLMVTTSGLAFVPYPPAPVYSATKAFLHNWLDAVRVQLKDTSVEVLELAPPYVQTELGGAHQATDPRAMPLDAYTAEVMQLLEAGDHGRGEILVEKVKPLRNAEKDGTYDAILKQFSTF